MPQLGTHFDFLEYELGLSRNGSPALNSRPLTFMMSFPLESGGQRAGAFEGRPFLDIFHDYIRPRAPGL